MRKKGISLITLIITLVVVMILAAVVILALGKNNPITDSRVAQVTQTRDSLSSGILIYATNVQAKTLGEIGVKDILIEYPDYRIVVDDRNTDKTIIKDSVEIKLYKLDSEKVQEKLNIDLKNQKDMWYIDPNGLVYMVYDDISSIPTYLKENNSILTSVANCVTYNGANITTTSQASQTGGSTNTSSQPAVVTTYTVTYDANGGSGTMDDSTGESVTIATNSFIAPEGKEFDSWNTEIDGSGTTYNAGATISANITLYARWKDKTYEAFSVGDEVTISNNGTVETFFVIKDTGIDEDTVTVITKENVNNATLTQTSGSNIAFSSTNYWANQYGVINNEYNTANGLNVDVGSIQSTDNKYALYAAQEYGKKIGGTEGRLLLYSEAQTLQTVNSNLLYRTDRNYKSTNNYLNYWLGTAYSGMSNYVYYVKGNEKTIWQYTCSDSDIGGIRPVITISKGLVTKVPRENCYYVGDTVILKNGTVNETFFVIKDSLNDNNKVTVIAKENIDTVNLAQTTQKVTVAFSETNYWYNKTDKVFVDAYSTDEGLNVDVGSIQSTDNKYVLFAAQEYGKKLGGRGRLLTNSERESLNSLKQTLLYANGDGYNASSFEYFWIAVYSNKTSIRRIGGNAVGTTAYYTDSQCSIRPVIEIDKSKIIK